MNGASAQLIAETVVRYSTPKSDPKILLVQDHNIGGEDPEDTRYVAEVLLSRYDLSFLQEPRWGLRDEDLEGYDLVWFNNPGHKMSSETTRNTLMRFQGGVVLQGDDLSIGEGFYLENLTGLRHLDNGTAVECEGRIYPHDNNSGRRYQVSLDPAKIPGANHTAIHFEYGNDIDNTIPLRSDLEILAYARGGANTCTQLRPAIVRYQK